MVPEMQSTTSCCNRAGGAGRPRRTRSRARLVTFVAVALGAFALANLCVLAVGAGGAGASSGDFTMVYVPRPPDQLIGLDRLFSGATLEVSGTALHGEGSDIDFDYVDGPTHLRGTFHYAFTGSFDPTTGMVRAHLRYGQDVYYNSGNENWHEIDETEGDVAGVLGPPGSTLSLTGNNWTGRYHTWVQSADGKYWFDSVNSPWAPLSYSLPALAFRREGGPQAVATVEDTAGSFWVSRDGGTGWLPLLHGDPLNSGDTVRWMEPDQASAIPRRTVIVFAKGFRYTLEPNSTVRIFDWGAQVEGGSVDVSDDAGNGRTGFPGGSEVTDVAPIFLQRLASSNARFGASVAASRGASRVVVAPSGTTVSAYEGRVQVHSSVTDTTVLLEPGQHVSVTPTGLGSVEETSFTDVGSSDPYGTAIVGMALKGIVNGYQVGSSSEFRPLDAVKRAQFAKMICGIIRLPVSEALVAPFSDLGPDDPASLYPHEFVAAAATAGITTGVRPGEFVPYDPIKRAQVVTMIVRAANQIWPGALETPPTGYAGELASFTDGTHGSSMRTAEFNGLLAGLEGFGAAWNPWTTATRGEVAQMLWNLITR